MAENINTYITGHHIYKKIWSPVIGEKLNCQREPGNRKDPFAVAVLKNGNIVGHVAKEHLFRFNKLLREGKTVVAVVTGKRENKRRNGSTRPFFL